MANNRELLQVVKALAIVLVLVSAGIVAYVAISSNLHGEFSLSPYTTAFTSTSKYSPPENYSLYVTGQDCRMTVQVSQDNTLYATLNVSQSFFYKAFARIDVTENSGIYEFTLVAPQWVGTTASALVYLPGSIMAHTVSVVTQNGAITASIPTDVENLLVSSTNGNVNVQGSAFSNATLNVVNGNVYISASSFTVFVANTVNGNIDVTLPSQITHGTMTLGTTNGNIAFNINRSSNLSLIASTVNGQVSVSNLPYNATLFTSRDFVGEINSAGANINLSAVNGNIRITGI